MALKKKISSLNKWLKELSLPTKIYLMCKNYKTNLSVKWKITIMIFDKQANSKITVLDYKMFRRI